ncbi:helix-turn-helix domain-containing protein [Collimonas fungivorans]
MLKLLSDLNFPLVNRRLSAKSGLPRPTVFRCATFAPYPAL